MSRNDGPVYGVELLEELPLGDGGFIQAFPSRDELQEVQKRHPRVVAAFEVLTQHYRELKKQLNPVSP